MTFGSHHVHDLPPSGNQLGEQPSGLIRQWPQLGLGRFREVRDDRGIDRIGLGTSADRLGEGADLGWIDDHDRQPGGRQRCRRYRLEAAGGFQCDKIRRQHIEPGRQLLQPDCVSFDCKGFSARAHGDVQAVFRYVDTNGDDVHDDPSLPNRASREAVQATVRVRWNDGRGTKLSHGLQGPREIRAPAHHRDL